MRPHFILRAAAALLLAAAPSLQSTSLPLQQQTSVPALDAVLTAGVQQRWAPGVVAIVVDKARVLYLGAAGQMNVKGRKAMRTDTVFRIASMTKPITAVAIMMLQEKGKLSVEDPVAAYLPAFANVTVIDTFAAHTPHASLQKPCGSVTCSAIRPGSAMRFPVRCSKPFAAAAARRRSSYRCCTSPGRSGPMV